MQYRIKEKVVNGKSFYYPQYKKFLFWRRFVWWGGEDGTFPHTTFYTDKNDALKCIADNKLNCLKKTLEPSDKTLYHYIN
jgi:hypothetical protein